MTIESIARPTTHPAGRAVSPAPHDLHALAREMVAHLEESVATCRTLPGEGLGPGVTGVVRVCLGWLIDRLRGGPLPVRTERLEAAAASWACEGIPIEAVMHAVHEGFKAGLDLLPGRLGPAAEFDIVAGTAAMLELLNLVTATVSKSYVREHKAIAGQHHTAAHTLTSALLAGHADSAMARECGIAIAAEYFVLAVELPTHPDEHNADLDRHVVARRKLRRVQAALATRFGEQVLSLLSVDGGTILVPTTACAESGLADLVDRLGSAARVPLRATVVRAPADRISTAARDAHELLDTVDQLGRAPGLYRFADLALHFQLTRPGMGRDLLDARLAPLDGHPDLLRTLATYIDNDLSRRRTARLLNVHPNTVDYRLRRVGALTGLDPAEADGLWYLRSALIARANRAAAHGETSGDTASRPPAEPRPTAQRYRFHNARTESLVGAAPGAHRIP